MVSTEEDRGKISTEEEDGDERKAVGGERECKKSIERELKKENLKLNAVAGKEGPSDLESGGDAGDVAPFEDLLQLVGTRGRWNFLIFTVCSISTFIAVLQTMSYQFLGATPDHWCHVAPLVEANWTQEQILTFAIPYSNNTGKHERCQMYEYDYEQVAELGYEGTVTSGLTPLPDNTSVVPCYSRDFNFTQNEYTVTTEWDLVCERRALYSTTQAAAYGGNLLGYFIFGHLFDRFGRRPVMLWTSLLMVITGFLTSASPSIEVYIFLKFLILFMQASIYLGSFVIIMETCTVQERSMIGTLFVLPWALGCMAVSGIAYLVRRWQWLQAAFTLPALSLALYYWFLPESIRWLILQGRYNEALEILRWGARVNRRTLPPDQDLLVAMEKITPPGASRDEDGQGTLLKRVASVLKQLVVLLSTRELRQRTLMVFFCCFAASMVYFGVSLNSSNLSADPYIYIFLGGLLEVPSYLLLWPAIVFLGRVKTLSFLLFVCALSILLLTIFVIFLHEAPVAAKMFLSLCGKMAITTAFQLVWIFTSELFPTKYRSMAVSQAVFMARVGSMCSPYINDVLGEVVVWAPSAIFGLVSLVAAGLSLLLPETKGRNLPENKSEDDPYKKSENRCGL